MTNEQIRKVKNAVIAVVCVVSVVVSAVNYFRPHEKDSAMDYIVFYETSETGSTLQKSLKPEIEKKEESEEDLSDGKISINKATKEELMTLQGIGETKAKAIIEYRNAYGSFLSIDELTEVKGIGESTLDRIRDKIKL